MKYPIAPNGIFWSIQGEGELLGIPMRFLRLAGCSIGCSGCDTDYRADRHLAIAEIAVELAALPSAEWVWLTGGEPTDHDLVPLVPTLPGRAAIATTGSRPFPFTLFQFVSVSPHGKPEDLWCHGGNQINLVPQLNGLNLSDWHGYEGDFKSRYVTPLRGNADSLSDCIEFIKANPLWRLGVQAHRSWRLP